VDRGKATPAAAASRTAASTRRSEASRGSPLADQQPARRHQPATLAITRRVPLPGCDHDHGLTLDPPARLVFIACDGNARLLTLDLATWQVTSTSTVGDQPDVLAYDPAARRLYVAAESGTLTILDNHRGHLTVTGRAYLADGAHVVVVDAATHDSYYPVPAGPGGHPALLIYQPAP